jgi:hypothetical protein
MHVDRRSRNSVVYALQYATTHVLEGQMEYPVILRRVQRGPLQGDDRYY